MNNYLLFHVVPRVPVYFHWSFWLFLFASLMCSIPFAFIIFLITIFVLFHEIGHYLAYAFCFPDNKDECPIVMYPFGAALLVNLEEEYKPIDEFLIAIAGPATNAFLALLFGFLVIIIDPTSLIFVISKICLWCNFLLCVFNLLPCYPMDGGRILRSLIVMTGVNLNLATKLVIYFSYLLCFLLFVFSFILGNIFLFVCALQGIVLAYFESKNLRCIL